jgi:hypothetical protein
VKPVLVIESLGDVAFSAADVVELVAEMFERSGLDPLFDLRVLSTEDELRSYEAGELVLYVRRPRQRGVYRFTKDGVEVRLVQTPLFPES